MKLEHGEFPKFGKTSRKRKRGFGVQQFSPGQARHRLIWPILGIGWVDISSTPKGSNNSAQGNALGCLKRPKHLSPERSGELLAPRDSRAKPLYGMVFWIAARHPGRCPGLVCLAPSGPGRRSWIHRKVCQPIIFRVETIPLMRHTSWSISLGGTGWKPVKLHSTPAGSRCHPDV